MHSRNLGSGLTCDGEKRLGSLPVPPLLIYGLLFLFFFQPHHVTCGIPDQAFNPGSESTVS